MFQSLERGRGATGFGPATFSYQDILAFALLSGIAPTPYETELLLLIDKIYLAELARLREASKPKGKS